MNKIREDIEWTFKLYALTLVLPIGLSIMNVIFCGILSMETKFGFWMNFKVVWIDYYFTGSFLDIAAWRWQLGLLFCSFLFTKFSD
jgi:hypothetical protein